MAEQRSRAAGVLLVVAVTVALSVGFSLVGLPSAVLFGSLLGGMAHALTSTTEIRVPRSVFKLGQALIGATIGTLVSLETLRQIGHDIVPIVAITAGTVVISLVAGRVLALRRDVSRVTGTFALIAGGASGVVAVARDLGADDRVVTVVQYLRVLVVLVSLPLVTAIVFHPDTGVGAVARSSGHLPTDLVYVVLTVGLGMLVARYTPITTATLLAPLAVGVVLAASGWLGDVTVPDPVQWLAYGLIGVQVGLRFTRSSLSAITRMLPVVTAIIVAMIALTALMGATLAWLTPVDGLTAYLATTPGGLFAVLATAADSGSDVTYVISVQLFRLIVILMIVPLLARWLRPADEPQDDQAGSKQ